VTEPTDTAEALKGARILLLYPTLVAPGGAMSYTLHLAEQLLAQGARVAILTMRVDRSMFDPPAGLEVISLSGPLTSSLYYWLLLPLWQRRINRAITAWRPDVLFPQVFPANWWGWLYKQRRPGLKLAWMCQEPSAFIHSLAWIRALRPWWKSLLALVLRPLLAVVDVFLVRNCDQVIVNSRFTAAELERVYGIAPDGIAYPGIDFPAFAGEGWQKERALITVARLTKFKRVDFLLEVFREVLRGYPDLMYHIVGQGEEELHLRELVSKMGLESRVVFHGAVTDAVLVGLNRKATLFLHGSIGEPFGMAPLEAIACGTPVVAHQSGGPKEFVTEECGRLIASLAVEDWAREISGYLDVLFSHPDFPGRVRECASRFDWLRTLRPAVEIIAALCAGNGHRPENFTGKNLRSRS
jgi:glycosyltransferase involved in cell wall biosynthesis